MFATRIYLRPHYHYLLLLLRTPPQVQLQKPGFGAGGSEATRSPWGLRGISDDGQDVQHPQVVPQIPASLKTPRGITKPQPHRACKQHGDVSIAPPRSSAPGIAVHPQNWDGGSVSPSTTGKQSWGADGCSPPGALTGIAPAAARAQLPRLLPASPY